MAFLTTFHGLIDDLTTGGTQKALTAEQGKNLHELKMNRLITNDNGQTDGPTALTLLTLGFDLSNAYLGYVNFSHSSLRYAQLNNSALGMADLSYVNFDFADLSYAILYEANLDNAELNNANLSFSDVTEAIFSNANLFFTNLSSSNLTNAKFVNANFTGSTGLNADINVALAFVDKNPNSDNLPWTLTWTDGLVYTCNPATGLFTHA